MNQSYGDTVSVWCNSLNEGCFMPPVTWIFHKCFINSGPNFCLIRIHFMVYQKMLCSKCHRRLPTGLYTINHIYILTSTLSTRGGCHNTYQYIDRYTFLKLSYKNNSNNWLLCYQWICKALRKKQIKSTQYGDIYKKNLLIAPQLRTIPLGFV